MDRTFLYTEMKMFLTFGKRKTPNLKIVYYNIISRYKI